ncbi:class I SAM-dependent methyltransferase [Paenibacillus sp. 1P07SE]|uniref:class I SAM-dependent methyltransferase n=1 Tax=Paenibacillus sp. 1P07SE TaxID=3132209 RepID=UPI0039A76C08
MTNIYGELCTEVYELSKPVGIAYSDVTYYAGRLKDTAGRVLEVGCGSGRVLIPLLQAGIQAEGIDNSPAMLASCRNKCREAGISPVLHEGDMSSFDLDACYDAIIIPGGSIQLIETREHLVQALACYHKHLCNDGILVLDTFLQTDFSQHTTKTRVWENDAQELITLEEKRVEVDLIRQRVISLLKYEKWREGRLMQSELQRLPLCWYGVEEFRLLLQDAGFRDVTIIGNYQSGSPPQDPNQMITYEAKK